MKRFTRRTVAAIVGIVLGWYVAGVVFVGQPSVGPGLSVNHAHASDADHDSHGGYIPIAKDSLNIDDTPGREHGSSGTHDVPHEPHSVGTDHHEDAALAAAGQLVPRPEEIPWFRPVLYVVGGLFVAAVVLGIPALKVRGPEPPDPADTHSH